MLSALLDPQTGLLAPAYATPITLLVVAGVVVGLAITKVGSDLVLLGGLVTLVITKSVTIPHAVHGFANEGLIAVAILFIVAEGIEQTGAVSQLIQYVLGAPKTRLSAMVRMTLPVAAMSAFLNNTPIVAVMLPVLNDWSKKTRISVSQLMLPLSFATILGGLCTVLGTSTTVVVNKLLEAASREGEYAHLDMAPLGLFELGWVGLPCCLAGLAYILLTTRYLLPDRRPARPVRGERAAAGRV